MAKNYTRAIKTTQIIHTEVKVVDQIEYLRKRVYWRCAELRYNLADIVRVHGHKPNTITALLSRTRISFNSFKLLTRMLEMEQVNGWYRPFPLDESIETKEDISSQFCTLYYMDKEVPVTLVVQRKKLVLGQVEDMRRRVHWRCRELGFSVSDVARFCGYDPKVILARIANNKTLPYKRFKEISTMFTMEQVNGWTRPFPNVPEKYQPLTQTLSENARRRLRQYQDQT